MLAKDVAAALQVTPARVSQWVSEGKLDGCFVVSGKARQFDLGKVAQALGRRLDPGQAMGNGRETRIRAALLTESGAPDLPLPVPPRQRGDTALTERDPDRYELARTQLAEEQARRARRENALQDGTFVLATEVQRSVTQALALEVRSVETMLREAARAVADKLGVDALAVRQVLMQAWRDHRSTRSAEAAAAADAAQPTDAERDADF